MSEQTPNSPGQDRQLPSWGAPAGGSTGAPEPIAGAPTWGTPEPTPGAPARGAPEPMPGPPAWGTPVPPPPQAPRRRRAGGIGAGLGGGAALAGKAGLLSKLFLAVKGLAVLGKFKVLLSMLVSVGAYTLFWGWKFALGFVILMAIHEFGHVLVLRAQGVPASAPMFVPFLGAFVAVKGPQRSVAEEAWSALAGPVAGVLGATACLQLATLDGSLLLRALAYAGFLLNLFNLIPALPLDGGRVAGALHPAIWLGGMALAVLLLVWRPSPVLFLVLILGGMEAWRRWRQHRAGLAGDYYSVRPATRAWLAAGYVAIAAACLWGMHVAYVATPA